MGQKGVGIHADLLKALSIYQAPRFDLTVAKGNLSQIIWLILKCY